MSRVLPLKIAIAQMRTFAQLCRSASIFSGTKEISQMVTRTPRSLIKCRPLCSNGFGLAGGPDIEFVEPDIVQQWRSQTPDRLAAQAFAAATGTGCDAPQCPNKDYPQPDPYDWRWYQSDKFSGLDKARSSIQNPQNRITIAHLDTGYKDEHSLSPQFLDTTRQRNFVDSERANDARDLADEGGTIGHGTGTLSILAGKTFG